MPNYWNVVLLTLCVIVIVDVYFVLQGNLASRASPQQDWKEAHGILPSKDTFLNDAYEAQQRKSRNHANNPTTSRGDDEDEEEEEEDMSYLAGGKGPHKVAGLNCADYGGPSLEVASEMVYWRDIPQDASFISPYKQTEHVHDPKYLTFEADEGGFNNIRMSMETAVALAHAMGRILVMPPEQGMYLLHKTDKNQKHRFTFTDFFHFDSVASEHAGLEIISFQEFLEREVMTGNIKNKVTGKPSFPRFNRTDWNGMTRAEAADLGQWLRTLTTNPIWFFDDCMVGFPDPTHPGGEDRLRSMTKDVKRANERTRNRRYRGKPADVDAPAPQRLDEVLAHRRDLCIYNEELQNAKVFHLMGDNASGARLLVHFYAFLFFEDWKQDLWTKRFIRDHLRYVDEIQCAAARVVHAMRQKAVENGVPSGAFDTFHIRRGDFQYKDTRVEAKVILDNIRDKLIPESTIYIATDERDKSFFAPFSREGYHIYFLDDFMSELGGINSNFYGMLDQRIASRGRTFIGCYFSTFTGYINRMRGYHSQKDKAEGWETGSINSWYYIPSGNTDAVREYRPISQPMWAREFPIGWRDLDRGIDEMAEASDQVRQRIR